MFPSPLVCILAAQSLAIVWLLHRTWKTRRELAALAIACEMGRELARCAYAGAYALTPEEDKKKLPPEWRAEIEKFCSETAQLGNHLMSVGSPSEVIQAVVRETETRLR
jgi:hypothetical protein